MLTILFQNSLEELILNRQQYKRAQAGVACTSLTVELLASVRESWLLPAIDNATAENRMYSGVQGEGKENQGELWGVKNIFKFSEHISLTEKSIKSVRAALYSRQQNSTE